MSIGNAGSQPAYNLGDAPAYPRPYHIRDNMSEPPKGLTIRQAYKMAALQGIMGNKTLMSTEIGKADSKKILSQIAGMIADAMVTEDMEHGKEKK